MKAKRAPKEVVEEAFSFTARRLAELYALNEHSLANDRALNRGIPYRKIGRKIRYFREDVEKYFNDRKVVPEN